MRVPSNRIEGDDLAMIWRAGNDRVRSRFITPSRAALCTASILVMHECD